MKWRKRMRTSDRGTNIEKEFPGDQALQQVHLARKAPLAAAKRKKVTLGAYVRSLNLRFRSSSRT